MFQRTDENSLSIIRKKTLMKVFGPCKYVYEYRGKQNQEKQIVKGIISKLKYCGEFHQEVTKLSRAYMA